jgi:signal transduction protein with GAF and PtsI domain
LFGGCDRNGKPRSTFGSLRFRITDKIAVPLPLTPPNWNSILLKTQTENFETQLTIILKELCESDGWKYGEVWIPDGKLLRCHPSYYMASEQLASFRRESETFTFTVGAGLPGRVWLLQQPEWIENVSLEPAIYYRSHLAKKVGLKAAVGVPILVSDAVVAVLILYNDEAKPPNEKLMVELSDRIKLS